MNDGWLVVGVFCIAAGGSSVAGKTAVECCKGAVVVQEPDAEDWNAGLTVVANGELGLVKVCKKIRNVTVA